MTKANSIAKELGDLPKDEKWLEQEIDRLHRKDIIVALEHLIDLHQWLDEKRKIKESCRVVGDSHTGKTVACESYALRNKSIQNKQQTPIVPVIYIMPPKKCTDKKLFKAIIEALRYRAVKGTISDFYARTMEVLKACKVEMLILDEADRLEPETFPDVRDINDKLKISVVLVGTDRLDVVIKRDEQVHNRFRSHRHFGKLTGKDFERTVNIWEEKILKLPVPSNLTQQDMLKILTEATEGYIGRLDDILRLAAIRSLSRGYQKIEKETLQEVVREKQG